LQVESYDPFVFHYQNAGQFCHHPAPVVASLPSLSPVMDGRPANRRTALSTAIDAYSADDAVLRQA
jgi:hypothetical protein